MDLRRDTTIEAILDQLIATGATDLGRLFGQLLELALQIERAQFRKASLYERTPKRQGYANGYKPKRIDTPRGRRPYRCPKPFDALVARYRAKHPDFADGLENYNPEGLAVFSLPEVNRKHVRRSNGIERPIQQELKRCTAKVNVFTNIASLERRSTAALVELEVTQMFNP